ncbi:hypothetical protein DYB37_010220, partial [Aphanomyces astaci]
NANQSVLQFPLRYQLPTYVDVFWFTLGRDPPVSMSPLKVHLANKAKPLHFKARRYSLPQREFMQKHVEEFESAGFTYRTRPVGEPVPL